jgi:enoyl-CoA hydratase
VEFKHLIVEKAEVATLTVNRPDALNALNRDVLVDFVHALHEIGSDPAVKVVIITGAGERAFIAGADIAAMSKMSTVEGLEFSRMGHGVMNAIEALRVPVIAAVNGFALGGGCEVAMACDLIVASEKARFGQPEINLGLIPGFGGTQRLAHRIGHARARELVLTGDMIDAKTAHAWGLVNQVVAPGELMNTARALAAKILKKSPLTVHQAKSALQAAATMNERDGLNFEQQAFAVAFSSEDRIEGTKAFVEKREPKWQNK